MLSSVTYLVTAENRPDMIARVVMLLHRLAVPIDSLTVKRFEKERTLTLTIQVEAIAGQAERLAENLMKIVHVMSVEIGRSRTKLRRSSQKSPARSMR